MHSQCGHTGPKAGGLGIPRAQHLGLGALIAALILSNCTCALVFPKSSPGDNGVHMGAWGLGSGVVPPPATSLPSLWCSSLLFLPAPMTTASLRAWAQTRGQAASSARALKHLRTGPGGSSSPVSFPHLRVGSPMAWLMGSQLEAILQQG